MTKIERFEKENYFLSNFFEAPVVYEGKKFKNNEAAFQSAKVLDEVTKDRFLDLPPNKAKSLGRQVKLRSDWEEIKDQVMYDCVKDKFTRNSRLQEKLLNTGQTELIEGNHWNDTYWGVCNGKGQNKLGLILMRVREELQNGKKG